ncbi:MAG: DUF805 domain-containing protein [Rhodomicrobium sp.]|jgi:uncharacterized membrane protein YhaH (DUF805 family)
MDRFAFIWLRFNGRIDRLTWIAFAALISLLEYGSELMLRRAFHWPAPARTGETLSSYLGDEISLLASLIFLWPSLAVDVKRWHDQGKSGWFAAFVYGPALALFAFALWGPGAAVSQPDRRATALLYAFGLVSLVYLILLAARKGGEETNRYGPPPP